MRKMETKVKRKNECIVKEKGYLEQSSIENTKLCKARTKIIEKEQLSCLFKGDEPQINVDTKSEQ